jgi:hypothetical protein
MRSVDARARSRAAHGAPVAALLLVLGACGDEGPESAPGTLTASVVSPTGPEGAALVTLVGQGMGAIGPSDEGRVFSQAHGDTVNVVVVNVAGGALRFTIQVADTTNPPAGTLVEVSGPDDRIRGLTGYKLELRP